MIFLGDCCTQQQEKQNSRVSTYKRKKSTVQVLLVAFVLLIFMVISTSNAQVQSVQSVRSYAPQSNAMQSNSGQTSVRLELLTNSSRLTYGDGSATQQTNLPIGSQVGLRVSSNNDTYIYIYNFNSVGDINLLTNPNYNFLPAGQVRSYPNNNSLYEVSGPAGRESVFAIASHRPLTNARLEELQTDHLRLMLGQQRGFINNGNATAAQAPVQDGWLADSIFFNVVDSTIASNPVVTNPVASNVPQAPAVSNYSPSQPAPNPAPPISGSISGPASTPNASGIGNGYKACSLAGLNLRAPHSSIGFRQRCINKSFDGSFESSATMHDVVVHFGKELDSQGFNYQGTTKGQQHDFRATFAYQGKTYQMRVEKSGQFYRFELLDMGPLAMNY